MINLTPEQIDWISQEFRQSYFDLYSETSGKINLRCPFCGDSAKSKTKKRGWFYKSEGSYHCFNCGKTCSGFGLLAQIKGCTISDIKKSFYLSQKNTEILPTSLEKRSSLNTFSVDKSAQVNTYSGEKTYIEPLKTWTDLTDECKQYLKSRHIFDAPGFDKKTSLYYDIKYDRIIFPWRENNKIVYYQARAIRKGQEPKYLFPSGLKKKIYGLDNLDLDLSYIAYTEGLLDAIFIKNCVAVGGLRPTQDQERKFKEEYSDKKLIWFSDNFWVDNASKDAIYRVCEHNPKQLIFKWPKNISYKDINEWVCKEKNYNKFWSDSFIRNNTITVAQAKILLALG